MPTIPPPPPIQLMSISLDKKTVNDRNNNVNKVEINVCSWAIYEPDIQKSCYFARVCEFTTPKECVYMQVDPMLQIGEFKMYKFTELSKVATRTGCVNESSRILALLFLHSIQSNHFLNDNQQTIIRRDETRFFSDNFRFHFFPFFITFHSTHCQIHRLISSVPVSNFS